MNKEKIFEYAVKVFLISVIITCAYLFYLMMGLVPTLVVLAWWAWEYFKK